MTAWQVFRDRVVATDPGLIRLRLALWGVLGIATAAIVLVLLRLPTPAILVASIAAMQATFTINDREARSQVISMVLATCAGAASLTVAAFGSAVQHLDNVLFVVLIFFVVYAQRFAPRGTAMGALSFFMFFFAMFLQVQPSQLPQFLFALAVGVASNAFVRFAVLPRRPAAELLRVRRAFRARLGAEARAAAAYLAGEGSDRRGAALRRADSRLHQAVLMIEDAISDVLDPPASELLRRRAIEVELAAQRLSIVTRRAGVTEMPDDVRSELVAALLRLDSLIEIDPRELPVISETGEFSKMLVAGSRLGDNAPGNELRRAIAELALADVNAQRVAENDYSAEAELPEAPKPQPKRFFAFDNKTRSAIQATIGGGLAVLFGELVSSQRWYWAVLTVFVVFLNTSTAGATFVKGFRRVTGTLAGIFGGMLLALLVAGHTPVTVVLLFLCVFGLVYTLRVSQLVASFFITCQLGLLYSLLGTFSLEVLVVRVAETFIGAAAGLVAAVVVLPVRTRTVLRTDLKGVLQALRTFLTGAEDLLSGEENISVIELSRELDRAVEKVRTTVEPLTHPISLSSRRDYGTYVVTTLDKMSYRVRDLAVHAEPALLAGDERLTVLIDRLTGNVDVLLDAIESGTTRRTLDHDTGSAQTIVVRDADGPDTRSVLSGLDRLDEWIVALGRALGVKTTESVQPTVRRRTVSTGPGTDSITSTSERTVRRST
ncbi:FUSC family protein [Amycolatopsis pigmentata]|uniref:FUSC family protein n=1 Tax=Amycolatopsis pigmentata TaxID=450801 RepID=A0ABW5FQ49_9PSEU